MADDCLRLDDGRLARLLLGRLDGLHDSRRVCPVRHYLSVPPVRLVPGPKNKTYTYTRHKSSLQKPSLCMYT